MIYSKFKHVAFAAIFILTACNVTSLENVHESKTQIEFVNKSLISMSGMFEDFTLIPLENNHDGMLSEVHKFIIRNNKMIFLDKKGLNPKVLCFDMNGKFISQIGRMVKAKNEYIWIDDMAVDEKGNVYLLDLKNKVLKYDSKGKYVGVNYFDSENRYKSMDCYDDKFMCVTYHRDNYHDNERDYLIDFYDKNYKLISQNVSLPETPLKESPFGDIPHNYSNGKVMVYDMYRNLFYLFNLKDLSSHDEYRMDGDNFYSYENMTNGDYGQVNYNNIYTAYYHDSKIFGKIGYNKTICWYEFDTNTMKTTIYNLYSMYAQELFYYDGYFYGIISPESMQHILNDKSIHTEDDPLGKVVRKYSTSFDLRNNYYIIKMKKKNIIESIPGIKYE